MIDTTQVDRLLRYDDPDAGVLSLYLTVPAEAAGLREMSVRLDRLLASVDPPRSATTTLRPTLRRTLRSQLDSVRERVGLHARDWLGHGIAIVRSAALGVDEHVMVGWPMPDRAVLGRRPYVRPLLAALHHAAPYVVAVVDRRHAWVFRVEGHGVESVDSLVGSGLRDPSYAGWAGLSEYGVRHRAAELARRHYRTTAAHLESLLADEEADLVVGGHEVGIVEFIDLLPDRIRARVVGTFVVDPHAMTPYTLRTRSAAARSPRHLDRERELRSRLGDWEAGGRAVVGAERCADMLNQSRADLLIVGGDDVVPGFVCDRCGSLGVDVAACTVCGDDARAVPDLVNEMVAKVVQQHGKVEFVGPNGVGAGAAPLIAVRLR